MHRSGTSALTGALGRLGLMLPAGDDLVAGHYDNPVHYESQALSDLDDHILRKLGGTWSAPPDLAPGWERSPGVLEVAHDAPRAARRAFPHDGPVVWKDPRLCLVLPLWRTILPGPLITILLWRAPMAVARSLRSRQGFPLSLGLALWERYNRDALAALSGGAAYVMGYEELLDDPLSSVAALARWLGAPGRVPLVGDDESIAHAAGSVSGRLARHDGVGDVPGVIGRTVDALTGLHGAHDRLPAVTTGPPPPWMADAIAQRRDYDELYARYMRYIRWRRRIPVLGAKARRSGPGVTGQGRPRSR